MIYRALGQQYQTPTVGLMFEDDNFLKLVNDPKKYFSAIPVPLSDARVEDGITHYTLIKILDIEAICVHYATCQEAIDAWVRRSKRVNYKKIAVIGNSWNLHQNPDLVKKLSKCRYPTRIFTLGDFNIQNGIRMNPRHYSCDVYGVPKPDIITTRHLNGKLSFEYLFNFYHWINELFGSQKN